MEKSRSFSGESESHALSFNDKLLEEYWGKTLYSTRLELSVAAKWRQARELWSEGVGQKHRSLSEDLAALFYDLLTEEEKYIPFTYLILEFYERDHDLDQAILQIEEAVRFPKKSENRYSAITGVETSLLNRESRREFYVVPEYKCEGHFPDWIVIEQVFHPEDGTYWTQAKGSLVSRQKEDANLWATKHGTLKIIHRTEASPPEQSRDNLKEQLELLVEETQSSIVSVYNDASASYTQKESTVATLQQAKATALLGLATLATKGV